MTCPWDPDPETTQDELERGWIDITRYLRSHTMTPYRDRLKKGDYNDKPAPKPEATKKPATPTPKRSTRAKKKN